MSDYVFNPKTRRKEKPSLDLGLALLSAIALPKICYTHREIAAWCEVSFQCIYYIERKALRKLRKKLHRKDPALVEMVEAALMSRRQGGHALSES